MKAQVVVIGGGDSFDTHKDFISYLKNVEISKDNFKPKRDWKDTLSDKLGENYEVLVLRMPNKNNACYIEWKIWFERVVPLLKSNLILIGHSLGGMFLAKYLSATSYPKKISAAILVSSPFDGEGEKESLSQFKLPASLTKFSKQAGKIYIVHSKDDPVVPFSQANKYKKAIPGAENLIFKNRGHFNQETFPEIVELIRTIWLKGVRPANSAS